MSQDSKQQSEAISDPKDDPGDQSDPKSDLDGSGEQVEASESNDIEKESVSAEFEADSREELIEKLVSARTQVMEMKDGYVRARAEVENIQRRSQNEIISARKYAIERFAQELLSVLDSLDQASKVEIEESSSELILKMKEGLGLILKQFDRVMEKFGITAVEAEAGVKFNPELHQAISMVPTDEVEPDHILSVMQKGFLLKDRLLRPAMVVIAQSSGD